MPSKHEVAGSNPAGVANAFPEPARIEQSVPPRQLADTLNERANLPQAVKPPTLSTAVQDRGVALHTLPFTNWAVQAAAPDRDNPISRAQWSKLVGQKRTQSGPAHAGHVFA